MCKKAMFLSVIFVDKRTVPLSILKNYFCLIFKTYFVKIFNVKMIVKASAKNMLKHAEEIKAKGAKYCDCPACSRAENILKEEEN